MIRRHYRRPDMPLQRFLADPARGDGDTADGTPGDCYRTALAGALGLTRNAVPHFVGYTEVRSVWWWEVQRWAAAQWGLSVHCWHPDRWAKERADGTEPRYPGGRPYVVVSGPSPRGPFHHSVVADLDLDVVHDPHPLGMGIASIDSVDVFLPPAGWTPPPRLALTTPTPRKAPR